MNVSSESILSWEDLILTIQFYIWTENLWAAQMLVVQVKGVLSNSHLKLEPASEFRPLVNTFPLLQNHHFDSSKLVHSSYLSQMDEYDPRLSSCFTLHAFLNRARNQKILNHKNTIPQVVFNIILMHDEVCTTLHINTTTETETTNIQFEVSEIGEVYKKIFYCVN